MRLSEQLDSIGSERLSAAARPSENVSAITRSLAWAVLALHRLEPEALWMFCIDRHIDAPTSPALTDGLFDSFEADDKAGKHQLLLALRKTMESIRSAAAESIVSEPTERNWRREQDLSEKVQAAFSAKRETRSVYRVHPATGEKEIAREPAGKRLESLPLTFRKRDAWLRVVFGSPSDVLGEYHNPEGNLRSRGFRQEHFIDALDRHLKNTRFWTDIYEEPSTVGWMAETGRDRNGRMQYHPVSSRYGT